MSDDTWLTPDEYLTSFRADTERLGALGRSLDPAQPVPSCPGWTVRDLLLHCSNVYSHKVSALRLGRAPQPGEWALGGDRAGANAADWHDEQASTLAALLRETGPAAECWTWFPGQDRTAFWFRRMAHEALVHRVDGELAAGSADAGSGDERLAADGVHEILTWFAGDPEVLAEPGAHAGAAGTVLVEAGATRLLVDLADDAHDVRPAAAGEQGDAFLAADPMALDLDLWGRPAVGVRSGGDEQVLERLRARLSIAT